MTDREEPEPEFLDAITDMPTRAKQLAAEAREQAFRDMNCRSYLVELAEGETPAPQKMKVRTSRVVANFGQWVVTTYGLECTTWYYPIKKARLGETFWESHIARKRWVDRNSFGFALHAARRYHGVALERERGMVEAR